MSDDDLKNPDFTKLSAAERARLDRMLRGGG
jgi:hypothetical protein